jgi:hypothetical protein
MAESSFEIVFRERSDALFVSLSNFSQQSPLSNEVNPKSFKMIQMIQPLQMTASTSATFPNPTVTTDRVFSAG